MRVPHFACIVVLSLGVATSKLPQAAQDTEDDATLSLMVLDFSGWLNLGLTQRVSGAAFHIAPNATLINVGVKEGQAAGGSVAEIKTPVAGTVSVDTVGKWTVVSVSGLQYVWRTEDIEQGRVTITATAKRQVKAREVIASVDREYDTVISVREPDLSSYRSFLAEKIDAASRESKQLILHVDINEQVLPQQLRKVGGRNVFGANEAKGPSELVAQLLALAGEGLAERLVLRGHSDGTWCVGYALGVLHEAGIEPATVILESPRERWSVWKNRFHQFRNTQFIAITSEGDYARDGVLDFGFGGADEVRTENYVNIHLEKWDTKRVKSHGAPTAYTFRFDRVRIRGWFGGECVDFRVYDVVLGDLVVAVTSEPQSLAQLAVLLTGNKEGSVVWLHGFPESGNEQAREMAASGIIVIRTLGEDNQPESTAGVDLVFCESGDHEISGNRGNQNRPGPQRPEARVYVGETVYEFASREAAVAFAAEARTTKKPEAKSRRGTPISITSVDGVRTANNPDVGVEAGPVSPAVSVPAAVGEARSARSSRIELAELVPDSGPFGARPTLFRLRQMLRPEKAPEGLGNAEEALAADFQFDHEDQTTVGVVVVTKTLRESYQHDYHVCARFHRQHLDDLMPIRVPGIRVGTSDVALPWFWFCRMYKESSGNVEIACHFTVFVNEERRELTVDSRWIDKQYSPYWRGQNVQGFDYILNYQLWTSSAEQTQKLLRSTLTKLDRATGSWKVTFANLEPPQLPVVFVETAWLADGGAFLSVWNRHFAARRAVFHGTRRASSEEEDDPFDHWRTLQPGRNLLFLPLGRIHNAVVHCELDGFVDKVFVSVDEQGLLPQMARSDEGRTLPNEGDPRIGILWPPDGAEVAVIRDQLDLPSDFRLAINGFVVGAPQGSTVHVFVRTDDWYEQKPVAYENGHWGCRVRLEGEGEYKSHEIYAMLVDPSGEEIVGDSVEGIVRTRPPTAEAPRVGRESPLKPIRITANDFQDAGGSNDRERSAGWLILGGDRRDGPNVSGGAVSQEIELPQEASTLKLRVSFLHGGASDRGKGIHSKERGGTVTLYINREPVHTMVCQHFGMHGDYWPEPESLLIHRLPDIDLSAKGIRGRSVTIKIVASPQTCMDLERVTVVPVAR